MTSLGDPTSPLSPGEQAHVADLTTDSAREAPSQQIVLAGVGDGCANCGAPLASDQRYCVNCGERRGKPRFTLADPSDQGTEVVTAQASRMLRSPRTSSTFNLIAGVATLLLAMGVGVLIGHNNAAAPKVANSPPTVITVGGAGTSTSGGSSSGSSAGRTSKSTHSTKSSSPKAAKPTPQAVIQKAGAAASKVVGGGAKVASPTVAKGQSCASGTAGCQNGKFTGGNFFGGG